MENPVNIHIFEDGTEVWEGGTCANCFAKFNTGFGLFCSNYCRFQYDERILKGNDYDEAKFNERYFKEKLYMK